MIRENNLGEASTVSEPRQKAILPLPKDVVAQIKSSTAIVSLSGVVFELLTNSVDAGATKIEVTVDFARGGCSIEDDGLGIAPSEFGEDGGLGKLYCTSKYFSKEPFLGRNGTFLASLAAVSLLTITSHHHEYRSHNSVTFHNSKAVERQRPTVSRLEIKYDKCGTRVTVRNLFGNLPVRVKQRAILEEHKTERDRLWDALKKDVTGLLLSWRHPLSLKVRDADHRTVLNFRRDLPSTATSRDSERVRPRSAELARILGILTEAGYVGVEEWPSWIPVSVSTPTVSIKGAISLDPAPTKCAQFISFGIRSLSSDSGHNELYDEANRLCALSDFGVVEDDVDVGDEEKFRRKGDGRFKNDGYTNRQLKGRKGVDRHPMFHFRIELKDQPRHHSLDERLFNTGGNLQAVLEVLGAMLTEWLSVHHFRPRKVRSKRREEEAIASPPSDGESQTVAQTPSTAAIAGAGRSMAKNASPAIGCSRKRKRSSRVSPGPSSPAIQQRSFSEWSRIKSGKVSFFDSRQRLQKQHVPTPTSKPYPVAPFIRDDKSRSVTSQRHRRNTTLTSPTNGTFNSPGGLPLEPISLNAQKENCTETSDPTFEWQDPSTKKTYLLNARTGCIVPRAPSRPQTDTVTMRQPITRADLDKSLRLPGRPKTAEQKESPWLNEVLKEWDNPIFKTAEQRIQQVSLNDGEEQGNHFHCSRRLELDKAFTESSVPGLSKLSKHGLCRAEVIAQLDRKFILVKLPTVSDLGGTHHSDALVIIDQHAADERIRVETLFNELCAPPPSANHQYRSKLGHSSQVTFTILDKPTQFTVSTHEEKLFVTHAPRFAAWGILYHIENSKMIELPTRGKPQATISVTALPPSISERCKADPKVLIDFLRSAVHKYAEDPHLSLLSIPSFTKSERTSIAAGDKESPKWLRKLASCSPGLIDLLNSRACRSAVMFNDELSLDECRELVERLARCVFPFMCAHGRPSMVPLVDLGAQGFGAGVGLGLGDEKVVEKGRGKGKGFVDAWKKWKRA